MIENVMGCFLVNLQFKFVFWYNLMWRTINTVIAASSQCDDALARQTENRLFCHRSYLTKELIIGKWQWCFQCDVTDKYLIIRQWWWRLLVKISNFSVTYKSLLINLCTDWRIVGYCLNYVTLENVNCGSEKKYLKSK